MTKVRLIGNEVAEDFVEYVNNFIEDKKVIDIKYQSHAIYDGYNHNGIPNSVKIVDRALIIYEE